MTLKIEKAVRKPFYVDHVQVTAENMEEVAKWCRGDVRTTDRNAKYIKVFVHLPKDDRQTMAFIGDQVLYAGRGFKVYTAKAFENSFEPADGPQPYVPVEELMEAHGLKEV